MTYFRFLPAAAISLLFAATALSADKPPTGALERLASWLETPHADRPPLEGQEFARRPIDAEMAQRALGLLWDDRSARLRAGRAAEVEAKSITLGGQTLRYDYKVFGEKPDSGRSLFISMHGGGGTTARVNDKQWQNQLQLYQPEEGIYLAPRAPDDSWNLWHKAHIDGLFDRLIENLVIFEGVNPNRVYLMGYSAGGDGVYQLAPRISDRFAAVAMMAGHPNETSPLGLRNIPFALQVGERDAAYRRNKIAGEWKTKLAELHKEDPGGYENFVEVRAGKGHWMNLEDKVAVPWMAKFERRRHPDRVVWKQDDVTHQRFYWLALPEDQVKARQLVVARREGQVITIESADGVERLKLRFSDAMLDLDQPVKVQFGGEVVFEGKMERHIEVIARTLAERGDREMAFSAELEVDLSRGDAE